MCTASGHKLTQMWWYRQQVLQLEHMRLCGRLLNEWFVNMYCRMEDERLAIIRHEQRTRMVTRATVCGDVTNDVETGRATGKKYYLPACVPGCPWHLRRLRVDDAWEGLPPTMPGDVASASNLTDLNLAFR